MTQDEIVEMARQAGFKEESFAFQRHKYEAFAKLVAAKEREACADICENAGELMNSSFKGAANAIRARGEA